ncbi:hypothetical protein [Shimia sp. SDUM112013]|uniref:hypothetical protein n=1 Tax=Shimia sp. SDUM112013 TaxID=3136160 RepID=UPI0032ECE845
MKKRKNSFRTLCEMGSDTSLQERIENIALLMLRAKGKYRDRLIDISLELTCLRAEDFTEELAPMFIEFADLVEKNRSGISVGFGHFNDPTIKDRERLAELSLDLLKGCAVAEAMFDTAEANR